MTTTQENTGGLSQQQVDALFGPGKKTGRRQGFGFESITAEMAERWDRQQRAEGYVVLRSITELDSTPKAVSYAIRKYLDANYYDSTRVAQFGEAVVFRMEPLSVPDFLQEALHGPAAITNGDHPSDDDNE